MFRFPRVHQSLEKVDFSVSVCVQNDKISPASSVSHSCPPLPLCSAPFFLSSSPPAGCSLPSCAPSLYCCCPEKHKPLIWTREGLLIRQKPDGQMRNQGNTSGSKIHASRNPAGQTLSLVNDWTFDRAETLRSVQVKLNQHLNQSSRPEQADGGLFCLTSVQNQEDLKILNPSWIELQVRMTQIRLWLIETWKITNV